MLITSTKSLHKVTKFLFDWIYGYIYGIYEKDEYMWEVRNLEGDLIILPTIESIKILEEIEVYYIAT